MIEKKSMPTDYLVKAADKDEMEEFQIEVEKLVGVKSFNQSAQRITRAE